MYFLEMWKRSSGDWLPVLIHNAPQYLKEELMMRLYGHHIENNCLFVNCHVDFTRQLVKHLKREIYFPGDCIAEKGDVDCSMYFIHGGEVEIYNNIGNREIVIDVLKEGDVFGESQGLQRCAHVNTFKARTVTDLLILNKASWEYLLVFFPASHEEIVKKAKENGFGSFKTLQPQRLTSSSYLDHLSIAKIKVVDYT